MNSESNTSEQPISTTLATGIGILFFAGFFWAVSTSSTLTWLIPAILMGALTGYSLRKKVGLVLVMTPFLAGALAALLRFLGILS